MNQMLKNDDVSCLPALASFCATNNPSNGLFRCHWRTLARFSIASSAASSNRKRQYACGLIDCSIMLWSNLNLSSFALFSLRSSDSLFFLSSFFRESFFSLSEVCHQIFFLSPFLAKNSSCVFWFFFSPLGFFWSLGSSKRGRTTSSLKTHAC